MKKIYSLAFVVLSFCLAITAQAQTRSEIIDPAAIKRPSLKIMPAIGQRTYAVQFEYPLSEKFSVEVLGGYKFGTDGAEIATGQNATYTNNALKSGYLIDVTGKYYFKIAPSGWFASFTVGASDIIYNTGLVRPYSFSLNPVDAKPVNEVRNTPNPGALRYAVGGGYQWTIIPRHLIANFMMSVGGYSNTDGAQFHLYFTPSVGYIF